MDFAGDSDTNIFSHRSPMLAMRGAEKADQVPSIITGPFESVSLVRWILIE